MTYNPALEYQTYIQGPSRAKVEDYDNPLVFEWKTDHGIGRRDPGKTPVECLALRTSRQQFKLDCALWYASLNVSAGSSEKTSLLKRFFNVLYHGGLLYHSAGWHSWASSNIPLASVLSHGGRVLIQLPFAKYEGDNEFFNWLGGGPGDGNIISANRRLKATHGIDALSFSEMKPLCNGRFHRVHEGKSDHKLKHYGINIALGGEGMIHPITGTQVHANGEFGHLYIYYMAPETDKYGGLLVGCEGSASIDAWERSSFYLEHHRRMKTHEAIIPIVKALWREKVQHDESGWTPDPTGGYHKLGARQIYGAGGGHKWDHLPEGPDRVYNAFIVDLADTGWKFLQNCSDFDPQKLGTSGAPPRPVHRPFALAPILTKTCLTSANLSLMKTTLKTSAGEAQTFRKTGFVPNILDIDYTKEHTVKRGLKTIKHHRPKTLDEIAPSATALMNRVQPTNSQPMDHAYWKDLSSAWGRRNKITPVDDALRALLTATLSFFNELREIISWGLRISEQNTLLIERIDGSRNLITAIIRYYFQRGHGGARGEAVRSLHLLAERELDLLLKAQQDIAQH